MLKLELKRQPFDFLSSLPAKQFRQVMMSVVYLLKNPYPQDAQKLKGYDFHRIDIGEYRIVYRIDDDTLCVTLIGKRNDDDIYRRLKRFLQYQ